MNRFDMKDKEKDKKAKVDLSNIPVESSLGLLAVGDIAFAAWRKIKKENNIVKGTKLKEDTIDE